MGHITLVELVRKSLPEVKFHYRKAFQIYVSKQKELVKARLSIRVLLLHKIGLEVLNP